MARLLVGRSVERTIQIRGSVWYIYLHPLKHSYALRSRLVTEQNGPSPFLCLPGEEAGLEFVIDFWDTTSVELSDRGISTQNGF